MMERDQLYENVHPLNDKLEMVYSLVDENEAIAMEARQESESSKLFAEQKEEEVKILEHSIEELESTINVLEKKVYEMDEEVERHLSISDSLKVELQALKERILLVECLPQNSDLESMNVHTGEKISRLKKLRKPQQGQEVLVHHSDAFQILFMNQEKDQELSVARLHVQELEALAASRQKEILKLLLHRMVPNARYSIWLDGKLELVVDPYQILERFDSSSFKYSASDSFNEASDSFFPRIPSNIQLLLQICHSASASSFEFI
ncbi:putative hexosyltransferase MUCI70 [Trifolium repens]|nr:putative hexosyltransferase MUCI70 [Trifolium repens]